MSPDLREEVELELAQIQQLLDGFAALRSEVRSRDPSMVETVALAGLLHSFYTGVENLFKRVSVHLGLKFVHTDMWHAQLLERMAQASETRPAVISEALYGRLRHYMSFRHLYRHAYSFELKWGKMAVLVEKVEDVFVQLRGEVAAFLNTPRSRD